MSPNVSVNPLLRIAAVTGARGMIGRYVVECLLARGWKVRVLSRKTMDYENTRVRLIIGDLNDEKVIEHLLKGVSAVFHCAAELHDESKMFDVNIKGTRTLLECIKRVSSIQYFCHLSSAGVIGPTSVLIVDEKTPCRPNNIYEKSKYEAEQLVLTANLGMNVCILRPANVFDAIKPNILSYALQDSFKDKVSVFIKGYEGAHLIHAKDVAAAAIFFMGKEFKKPEVFLVSYDEDVRNTVAGAHNICCAAQKKVRVKILFALPNIVPYFIRKLRLGKSLHGRVRFSEKKLKQTGFKYPLGFEKAIKAVCCANEGETR